MGVNAQNAQNAHQGKMAIYGLVTRTPAIYGRESSPHYEHPPLSYTSY